MKFITFILGLSFFINANAQEIYGEGCNESFIFYVILKMSIDSSTHKLYYKQKDFIYGTDYYDDIDTVFINIQDTDSVFFTFRVAHELGNFMYSLNCYQMIKNDSTLNDSLYDTSFLPTFYSLCSDAGGTYTLLYNTTSEGCYQLKNLCSDAEKLDLPVIKVVRQSQAFVKEKDGINERLTIYPNPIENIVNIKHGAISSGEVLIYDTFGILVSKVNLDSEKTISTVDITSLPKGTYIFNVMINGEKRLQEKIIKN